LLLLDSVKKKHFEELLQKEKQNRMHSLLDEKLGLNASLKEVTSELSSYDNHPGDLGTETFEAEKNFSFRLNDKFILSEIETALNKIEDGTFGVCEACKTDINEERLEIRPFARLCIECENDFELKPHDEEEGRPIEEQVLYPPFGRSFTDYSVDDSVEYDGEDTWQQLNTYNYTDTSNPDQPENEIGTVEAVEKISNSQYRSQLP
jgi:YteA family regulatory protein